jgi:hypothetical protein
MYFCLPCLDRLSKSKTILCPENTEAKLLMLVILLAASYPGSNLMANSLDDLDTTAADWHYTEVRGCLFCKSFHTPTSLYSCLYAHMDMKFKSCPRS